MGIDQPRDDHLPGHVQNHIGVLWQRFSRADLLDEVTLDEQTTTSDLTTFTIHCHQKLGILDQQSSGHRCSSSVWTLTSGFNLIQLRVLVCSFKEALQLSHAWMKCVDRRVSQSSITKGFEAVTGAAGAQRMKPLPAFMQSLKQASY